MVRFLSHVKPLGLVLGVTLVLAAPSTAGASLGEQCSGSSIVGEGSLLQAKDQESLTFSFNRPEDHSPRACSGTQGAMLEPKVSYLPSEDLAALESWGVNGHAADFSASNAFIATDEPPNATQREEIVAHSSEPHWASLETIPFRQYTTAIIVNLPTHCKANNETSSDRGFLVLTNRTLEKIWRGQIQDWNEITDSGDVVENLLEKNCNPNTPITRIVSRDDGGPLWTLEKYLYLIDKEKNIVGSEGWRELAEGSAGAEWPGAVTRPSEEGEEAVVNLVASTPGSIAAVNLTLHVEELFTGLIRNAGEGHERFIAPIQDNGLVGASAKYIKITPKSFGHECSSVEYTNDGVSGLPPSTFSLWNSVTTKTTEPGYTLCGLSYMLALTKYSEYPGTTEAQATTVSNYLRFVFSASTGGGLEKFKPDLSSSVLEESRRGVEAIQY